MHGNRVSVRRTVYYDEPSGNFCQCAGKFWKTCSLRVSNSLPCKEAIVSITPIVREEADPAPSEVRSLDKSLSDLTDSLRSLQDKYKI